MACIDPQFIEKIKKLDLTNMSSTERIKALDDVMGSGGKDINLLYEKSLLLKNKKGAFSKFVDDLTGVSSDKKAKIKEKMAANLAVKQGIINDEELLGIVQDTLNRKYDLDIPDEVVSQMFKIRQEIDNLKKNAVGTLDHSDEKLAWGIKERELFKIIDNLKNSNSDTLIQTIKKSLQESKFKVSETQGFLGKTGKVLEELIRDVVGIPAKGIKAAWDASYIFRQGLKVLTADPTIWKKNVGGSLKSWTNVYKKEFMEDITDAFYADIVTRDLYQSAIDSKLAIGIAEDFFPTNVAEKIPLLGNLFKASDDSFTMFSQGTRMDLFEKYVNEYAKRNGAMPSSEIMKDIAQYVNALTGRGGLGKAEAASSWLNQLFFSARYQVANLKTFTDPLFSKTPEVRKIAAKNLAIHSAAIFTVMTTLSAFTDVGFDPRQTTFGKVRIPGSKKWVDVTGGLASYVSLIGKMYDKMQTKPKYGQGTALDLFTDFLKGKLAPVPGAIRDYLAQRDFGGKKPTTLSTLRSLFVPITADNVVKNLDKKDDSLVVGLSTIFDILGAGVSQPTSKREGTYNSPIDLLR